jgi:hypothetical protein
MKFTQKIKDIFNVSLLSKLLIVVLIVISTLFPSLFDPEHANWKEALSNLVLNIVITYGAFISQYISSRAKYQAKDKYKESSKKHIDQIHLIQEKQLSTAHQCYVKDTNEKNRIDRVKDIFMQYEIPFELFEAEPKLIKTALSNNIINKEQLSIIRLCRRGKFDYDKYDVRDLTATQVLKKYKNSNKSQQAVITASNILGKTSFLIAFAIIFAMFTWDSTKASGIDGQSWINLSSRLFTFVGGLWTGDTTGREIVEDDIRLFDKFYNFNSKFVQDFELGIYKPKEEDMANNIIERLKALNQAENKEIEEDTYDTIELTEEEYNKMKQE